MVDKIMFKGPVAGFGEMTSDEWIYLRAYLSDCGCVSDVCVCKRGMGHNQCIQKWGKKANLGHLFVTVCATPRLQPKENWTWLWDVNSHRYGVWTDNHVSKQYVFDKTCGLFEQS